MLKRIYIKGLWIIDTLLGRLHLYLEKKGILKRIGYTTFSSIENSVLVSHKYPVNYDPADKLLFDHYTGYQSANETIFEFENVCVAERGIVFKGMNNSWTSVPHIVFRADFGWLYLLKNYLFRKKIVAEQGRTAILLYDFWSSANYYHWLVDAMPRLFAVRDLLKDERYTLLIPSACPSYIRRTLSYFDIASIIYIKKDEYLFAGRLLLPYYLAGSGHIHPPKVREVKQFFVNRIAATATGGERIFVSRSRQKARRVVNENELMEVLKAYNFSLLFFEDYTFEQQVQLAKGAKILVTSHGANMTNCMFMPEGSKVLELIREDKPNFCYWALASVAGLHYHYQLCSVEGNDHLLVNIDRFKLNLEKLINV